MRGAGDPQSLATFESSLDKALAFGLLRLAFGLYLVLPAVALASSGAGGLVVGIARMSNRLPLPEPVAWPACLAVFIAEASIGDLTTLGVGRR